MSTYTQTTFFGPKDNLTPGNPDKKILGTQFDVEFQNIEAAVNTNFGSNDVANTAQAKALTLNTVLITPKNLREALEGPTQSLDAVMDSLVVRTTDITIDQGSLTVSTGNANVAGNIIGLGDLSIDGAAYVSGPLTVDSQGADIKGNILAGRWLSGSTSWISFYDTQNGAKKGDIRANINGDTTYYRVASGSAGNETMRTMFFANGSDGVVNFTSPPVYGIGKDQLVYEFEGRHGSIVSEDDDYTIYEIDDSTSTYPLDRASQDRNFLSDADKVSIGTALQSTGSIDQLADVDTTGAVIGDYLQFDGADWVPSVPVLGTTSARYTNAGSDTPTKSGDCVSVFDTVEYNTVPSGLAVIDNTGDFSAPWSLTATVDCIVNITLSYSCSNYDTMSDDDDTDEEHSEIIIALDSASTSKADCLDASIGKTSDMRRTKAISNNTYTYLMYSECNITSNVVMAANASITLMVDGWLQDDGDRVGYPAPRTPATISKPEVTITVTPLTVY